MGVRACVHTCACASVSASLQEGDTVVLVHGSDDQYRAEKRHRDGRLCSRIYFIFIHSDTFGLPAVYQA